MSAKRDKPLEWGGFRLVDEDVAYHIGPLPGRKRVALYRKGNGVVWPIAYFNTEKEAERFLLWMERWANLSNNAAGLLKRMIQ